MVDLRTAQAYNFKLLGGQDGRTMHSAKFRVTTSVYGQSRQIREILSQKKIAK